MNELTANSLGFSLNHGDFRRNLPKSGNSERALSAFCGFFIRIAACRRLNYRASGREDGSETGEAKFFFALAPVESPSGREPSQIAAGVITFVSVEAFHPHSGSKHIHFPKK
jgi:hypothetical protein